MVFLPGGPTMARTEITLTEQYTQRPRKAPPEGPSYRVNTHKVRSAWFQARESWPLREPPVGLLTRERARAAVEVQPAPGTDQWSPVGPANIGGRMTCVICHPTAAERLWAGAAGGGVWRSVDAGQSWEALWHDEPSLNVGALAIDPQQPDTLYCGTGEANLLADAGVGVGRQSRLARAAVERIRLLRIDGEGADVQRRLVVPQRLPALPGVDTAPDTPAGRTRPEPLRGGRVADYAGHPAADVRRADRRPLVGSGGGLHLDGGARAFPRQQTDRRLPEGPRLTGLEPGAADFVGVDAIRGALRRSLSRSLGVLLGQRDLCACHCRSPRQKDHRRLDNRSGSQRLSSPAGVDHPTSQCAAGGEPHGGGKTHQRNIHEHELPADPEFAADNRRQDAEPERGEHAEREAAARCEPTQAHTDAEPGREGEDLVHPVSPCGRGPRRVRGLCAVGAPVISATAPIGLAVSHQADDVSTTKSITTFSAPGEYGYSRINTPRTKTCRA